MWVKKTSLELNVSGVVPPASQEKCFRSGKGQGENLQDLPSNTSQIAQIYTQADVLLVALRSLTLEEDLFPHDSGGWFQASPLSFRAVKNVLH